MELKYLVARWHCKRVLFIVLPDEVKALHDSLESHGAHVFVAGTWNEDEATKHRLQRWIGRVSRWVITSQLFDSDILSEIICKAHISGTPVTDLDSFLMELDPTVPANPKQLIHLLATYGVHQDRYLKIYTRFKYFIEPMLALVLALLLSPIMILVAIAVKFTSIGPIIYRQERVGYHGKIFKIYKFRSMLLNAEKGKARWAVASKSDPSLTPIGGFLRATHLDELPQLWNIISRDVSFIGPRPERPEFVKQLIKECPLFRLRTLVKPGITGWAQVQQGYANTVSDSVRKLELDLFYLIKHSPRIDLEIVIRTFSVLVSGGTEEIKRRKTSTQLKTLKAS